MQSTTDSFENLRKDFPVLNRRVRDDKKLVYFDNAATTQKPNQVIDAISDLNEVVIRATKGTTQITRIIASIM